MFQINEVKDNAAGNIFIRAFYAFYKNDPSYIIPLESEVKKIFDPKNNSFFKHGDCNRWILYRDGKPVGRIAAFINYQKTTVAEVPAGGVGFFECINDQEAANTLFTTAFNWLKAKGMQAAEGPINFGENDSWWGLLIQGFRPPSMSMNYNPPYFQQLFENFGWQKSYDQLTNVIDLRKPVPERFTKIAEWVSKKPEYRFVHFSKKEFSHFAEDFKDIYNDAWRDFENFIPIDSGSITDTFKRMKPILDEKIIWFAYHNNVPVAFVLCLPDTNQVLRYVKGKLNLWGKLKYLWYSKTVKVDRIRAIVMGVKQKYQHKGIESALIYILKQEVVPRNTFMEVELAWVGDFNTKMMDVHAATGAHLEKVHRTYKFKFDN
ncbi:MAG: GNAT family N-acetyltransferase [Ferruginibacter sp.]